MESVVGPQACKGETADGNGNDKPQLKGKRQCIPDFGLILIGHVLMISCQKTMSTRLRKLFYRMVTQDIYNFFLPVFNGFDKITFHFGI